MKTIINIIILLLIAQLAIAQKKSIKLNQLFLTNKITEKSVKAFKSTNTLENFGELIKKEATDQTVESSHYFYRYTFEDITFYTNEQNKVTTFTTCSKNIAIEKQGMFSFSPNDHIDKIAAIFPEEVKTAHIIHRGIDNIEYLAVWIKTSGLRPQTNEYIDFADCALVLLFNPETKILEEIFYWIRP